jgi:hypothetical protein
MRRAALLACFVCVALGVVPVALSVGPRTALGTVSISLPAKGKAAFAMVTVTGALQFGMTEPGLTLALNQDPRTFPASVAAAAGATKLTRKGGRVTVRYAVWLGNRGAQSPKQKLGLVVIGAHSIWAGDPQIYTQSADCRTVKQLPFTAYFRFLGHAGPRTQLTAAFRLAHCG